MKGAPEKRKPKGARGEEGGEDKKVTTSQQDRGPREEVWGAGDVSDVPSKGRKKAGTERVTQKGMGGW